MESDVLPSPNQASECSRQLRQLTHQIRVLENTLTAIVDHAMTIKSPSSEETMKLVQNLLDESRERYAELMRYQIWL